MPEVVYARVMDVTEKDIEFEDGGMAAILQVEGQPGFDEFWDDGCFFIRLQSWQELPAERATQVRIGKAKPDDFPVPAEAPHNHPKMRGLIGKRIRVTVEVLEPDA